jgi:hypothetical protein
MPRRGVEYGVATDRWRLEHYWSEAGEVLGPAWILPEGGNAERLGGDSAARVFLVTSSAVRLP